MRQTLSEEGFDKRMIESSFVLFEKLPARFSHESQKRWRLGSGAGHAGLGMAILPTSDSHANLGLTRFGGRFSCAALSTECISSNLIGLM
jgi:hypothetical protein